MKRAILLAALLFAGPAIAQQTTQVQKDMIDSWVSMIVTQRIKKEWTPKLYAAPATADELGTMGGIAVTPDATMKERVLQIRNLEPFPDIHQFTRQPIVVPANDVMAERQW